MLIIGKKSCSRCEMVKNILRNKNISFEYQLIENLSEDEQNLYLEMAKTYNKLSMPLIIRDEKLIDIQEV